MHRKQILVAFLGAVSLWVGPIAAAAKAPPYVVTSANQIQPNPHSLAGSTSAPGTPGARGSGGNDSWELGWVAVSAFLTVFLAGGTVLLALATSRDVRARKRPMVWANGEAILRLYPTGMLCDVEYSLKNIGGGPAVSVYSQASTVVPGAGGGTPGVLRGSIAPNYDTLVQQSLPGEAATYVGKAYLQIGLDITIKYLDVSGHFYRTDLVYGYQSGGLVLSEAPTGTVELQVPLNECLYTDFAWFDQIRLGIRRRKERKKVVTPPHLNKHLASPKRASRRNRWRSDF